MKTKTFLIIAFLCPLLAVLARGQKPADSDANITNRVAELLDAYAGADDLMDEQLLQKRAELEAMGERAFPALCSILKTKTDPVYQARIIEVFLRTDGDSTEPLEAVRKLLRTRQDNAYGPAHQAALKYLGKRGGVEDIFILNEYSSADDLVTKTVARESRAMIEGRGAVRPHSNTLCDPGITNSATENAGE